MSSISSLPSLYASSFSFPAYMQPKKTHISDFKYYLDFEYS